jgi:stearoyl-CoA desaturase (delta-9 desaturase)
MVYILVFFFAHWFLSLFVHTFFLHRFASHQMYTTSKGWERFFYVSTWFLQGSSYLVPHAYAVMHRMHHVYSDTEKDPHSPHFFKDVVDMMKHTYKIYSGFNEGTSSPDPQFTKDYLPIWKKLDRLGNSAITRISFGVAYVAFYVAFAPAWYWYLLLPIHFFMGPIQGAIVNWCGHKYGYRNYNCADQSKNTTPWGVLLLGELFQNNHHKDGQNANFARKWFEFDTTYQVMKLMNFVGIIKLVPSTVVVDHPAEQGNKNVIAMHGREKNTNVKAR